MTDSSLSFPSIPSLLDPDPTVLVPHPNNCAINIPMALVSSLNDPYNDSTMPWSMFPTPISQSGMSQSWSILPNIHGCTCTVCMFVASSINAIYEKACYLIVQGIRNKCMRKEVSKKLDIFTFKYIFIHQSKIVPWNQSS